MEPLPPPRAPGGTELCATRGPTGLGKQRPGGEPGGGHPVQNTRPITLPHSKAGPAGVGVGRGALWHGSPLRGGRREPSNGLIPTSYPMDRLEQFQAPVGTFEFRGFFSFAV